mgnify:CR=1 FL=1
MAGLALLLSLTGAGTALARPLPSDPRILTGKLPNGVTWMYRQHGNPPGKMAMAMHVSTGSFNETDRQRGVAHFLEHMIFNGTENFPPGALIPYFESIGMKFGADVNASTSMDRTRYLLYLPSADLAQVEKALMVFSDYAFRATLDEKEIEKERGVILEEARGRKNAEQRIRDKLWPQLYIGSRLATRLPIGDPEVVATVPRAEIVDYYRTWYRPENITVVMVGDAEPKPVMPLLEKWFGAYTPTVPARTPSGAGLKPFTSERAIVITDPEVTTGRVQFLSLRPGRPPALTMEQARTELVESIGNRILSRRFTDRIRKGQVHFRSAGTAIESFYRETLAVGGAAMGDPTEWARMLEELILEVSRAAEHGFLESEMKLIRKEAVASRERAVRTEPTTSAKAMLDTILGAIHESVPVLSAQQDLDLIHELLPTITREEVNATFRSYFTPGTFAYVVTLPEKADLSVPKTDEVLAAARSAWARKVAAPTEDEREDALLAQLPEPGTTVETAVDRELGITSAWLSNGARVHHRFMDYKKDSVSVSITFAGGVIEETAANLGISTVAGLAIATPATSRLDSSRIRDLLVGKNTKVSGGAAANDTFVFQVAGSPQDLATGLQLAYALITDGVIEPTAFRNWKTAALRSIEQSRTSVTFHAAEALSDLLSGGDPRRRSLDVAEVEALTIEKAQAWRQRLCREAPIEVAVVGELPWDQARVLVERYVGSLPKRSRSADHLDGLRRLARGKGPLARHIEVETVTPTAVAYAGFAGCEGRNADDRRALQVAASILTSRLIKRVREDLSLVYSISAESAPSWIYRDAGRFQAGARCKPGNMQTVAEEIHRAFTDFADAGPTADEMEAARRQILNRLDTGMKEPAYWFALLSHLDLRKRSLDEPKTEKAAYTAMTPEQVRAAFRRYFVPERSFVVTAQPRTPTTQAATEPSHATSASPP